MATGMAARKPPPRSRSCSSGLLLAAAEQLRQRKRVAEERHQKKVRGTSHGLYCRTLPPEYGADTCERFWRPLQRELERQHALLDPDESSSGSDDEESKSEKKDAPAKGRSLKSYPPAERPGVTFVRGLQTQLIPTRAERAAAAATFLDAEQTMLYDIREGCRVVILGRKPVEMGKPRVWPPTEERRVGSREDALKIWKTYGEILDMGHNSYVDADLPGRLTTMSWTAVLLWAEQFSYDEGSALYKSSCASLQKGLAAWLKKVPAGKVEEGIPLLTFLQWMWPSLSYKSGSSMLMWICQFEIEKLQLPAPPLIDTDDRHQIAELFQAMDVDNNGYLSAQEMAGGEASDIMAQLRNCIDPDGVKIALGGGSDVQIRLPEFFELMCADGFRGHPATERAILRDGRTVIHYVRKGCNFTGWILRDTPDDERQQWRLVDAIEAQMKNWTNLGDKMKQRTSTLKKVLLLNRSTSTLDGFS